MTPRWTHKGWLWFCPIYLSIRGEDLIVAERHWVFAPVFLVCAWLDQARIMILSTLVEDYEPMFAFRITGEIDQ